MTVRRIVLAFVCLVTAVGAWLIVAGASNPIETATPQSATVDPAAKPAAAAETGLAYTNEQEWIVWDVASSIEVMARFEPGVSHQPSFLVSTVTDRNQDVYTAARFTLSAPGMPAPATISVEDHMWAPATFESFARARLGAAATTDPDPGDTSVIEALTTPTAGVLIEQDRRVSARLAHNMRSPSAHEDAALLLAAFALRESAGPTFNDIRQTLSALTAHLATARVMRGEAPASPAARLAEIALATLVGRDAEAVKGLDAATPMFATAGERAWARALRIRATRDYRLLKDPAGATLREQLAYGREVLAHVSASRYLSFVGRVQPDSMTDWCRIGVTGNTYSVDAEHAFVETGLAAEQAEAREVWAAFSTEPFKIEALNDAPAIGTPRLNWGSTDVHVLDWPLWAAFLQRHLAASLFAHATYYDMLAWKERRERLASELEEPFGRLTLYPIVLRIIGQTPEQYRWAVTRATGIPRHLVTPRAWKRLLEQPDFVDKREPFASDAKWFFPMVPAGTAYDLRNRSLRENCDRPAPLAQVERWAAMAPYDDWVIWSVVWRRGSDIPTASRIFEAYGALADYDIWPSYRIFTDLPLRTAADTLRATRKLCELDGDYCGDFATALVQNGQESRAVAVFDRWIATCPDRVRVSNNVTWPVRYYLAHGRRDRAFEIAEDARSTGSGAGMQVYGEVLERMEKYGEAEQEYQRIVERYGQSWALGTFYLRQFARGEDPMHYEKASAALKDVFPDGIERGDLVLVPAPPPDGVRLIEFGRRAARMGLKPDDIIVKVNGIRVRNVGQYMAAAAAVDGTEMTLMVHRGRRLVEWQATVPERWFGVRFENHKTK